jgi:hypothetical protein
MPLLGGALPAIAQFNNNSLAIYSVNAVKDWTKKKLCAIIVICHWKRRKDKPGDDKT